MSQTSAEINANTNPPECVLKFRMRNPDDFTSEDAELLNGWEEWSLEDIIHRLNSAKWSVCLGKWAFGEIVFLKLLEATNYPNIPFEISEMLYILLSISVLMILLVIMFSEWLVSLKVSK